VRNKSAARIARGWCGNSTESSSVTRWETDPIGGPHLAVKRREGRALTLSCWAGSAVGWASSWAVRGRKEGGGREQAVGEK